MFNFIKDMLTKYFDKPYVIKFADKSLEDLRKEKTRNLDYLRSLTVEKIKTRIHLANIREREACLKGVLA